MPALWKREQKVILGYRVSLMPVWATKDPVWNKRKDVSITPTYGNPEFSWHRDSKVPGLKCFLSHQVQRWDLQSTGNLAPLRPRNYSLRLLRSTKANPFLSSLILISVLVYGVCRHLSTISESVFSFHLYVGSKGSHSGPLARTDSGYLLSHPKIPKDLFTLS